MKNFKVIFMIMVFFSIQGLSALEGTSTDIDTSTPDTSTPITTVSECSIETDDKKNSELLNTLPAVNILNLSGQGCTGLAIDCFVIRTLPNAEAGTLYLANSETEVVVGQFLSLEESDGLRFDPNENFEGEATFTYASVGKDDVVDSTPATVTLQVVAPVVSCANNNDNNETLGNVVHTADCECEDYEKSIPTFSKLGLFAMFILSAFMGTFFMRKEPSL